MALSAIHGLAPQRSGAIAISQVFAPHLFLPLIVLLPLALARGTMVTRLAAVLAVFVGLIRFGPGMVSLPAEPTLGAEQLNVMTWNLAAGQAAGTLLVERLIASDAEIVGLQEVRPEHVAALEAEPRVTDRFPYRVMEPDVGVLGIALLSVHPLLEVSVGRSTPLVVATVEVNGASAVVATAHPLPARIQFLGGLLPFGYDATVRDRSLADVREALVREGSSTPLVLVGDFNVTDREPGYADLTADLVDAHAAVGLGTGSTWRPATADFLPFGLLRIDYVFTGNGARPLTTAVDCPTNAGDHCLVSTVVELP